MAKLPWTPWHQAVTIRDELKTGELPLHMFAADLYEVLMQGGKRPLYETAPAENTLTQLLELPVKQGLGVLVLLDEVLMYAREKVAQARSWRDRLLNLFQYLTQAATKVDRCCVVASLLATDPTKSDEVGRQLLGDFYDIFRRQKEEGVEPVVKEDVAELLRRRFFTPESIKDREAFRQHVIAALKGIQNVDEQTVKAGSAAEERFLKSFPFHPDLTEVFYSKWTQLARFQRTRGILRTFALALREAEKWDQSPLIGPCAFLNVPGQEDISEAMRELVTVADTEEHQGRKQAWTPILVGELIRAQEIQKESVGLRFREVEQAVVATFLHSQPIGQSAKTRDLTVLVSGTRPARSNWRRGWLAGRTPASGSTTPCRGSSTSRRKPTCPSSSVSELRSAMGRRFRRKNSPPKSTPS